MLLHRSLLCIRYRYHPILYGVRPPLYSTSHRHHDISPYPQDLLRTEHNDNLWYWNPYRCRRSSQQPAWIQIRSAPVLQTDGHRSDKNVCLSRFPLKYHWLRNGNHVRSRQYGSEDLYRNAFCLHRSSYDAGSSLDEARKTHPQLPLQGTYCLCNDPSDRMSCKDLPYQHKES